MMRAGAATFLTAAGMAPLCAASIDTAPRGAMPTCYRYPLRLLRQADVVDVAAVAAGGRGLRLAHIDPRDRLAANLGADDRRDVVPGVHGQVAALVGGVQPHPVLVDRARVAQVGAVGEDQVEGYAGAVVPADGDVAVVVALGVDPVGEGGARPDGEVLAAEVEDLGEGPRGAGTQVLARVHEGG